MTRLEWEIPSDYTCLIDSKSFEQTCKPACFQDPARSRRQASGGPRGGDKVALGVLSEPGVPVAVLHDVAVRVPKGHHLRHDVTLRVVLLIVAVQVALGEARANDGAHARR